MSRKLQALKKTEAALRSQVDELRGSFAGTVDIETLLAENDGANSAGRTDAVKDHTDDDVDAFESQFSSTIDNGDVSLIDEFHWLKIVPIVSGKLVERNQLRTEFECKCVDGDCDLFSCTIRLQISQISQRIESIQMINLSSWVHTIVPFIRKCAQESNVLLLMKGLSNFARLTKRRHSTFKRLAKKFDCKLWFRSSSIIVTRNGVDMALTWPIDLDDDGEAIGRPSLHIKLTGPMLHAESKLNTRIVGRHDKIFRHLVQRKGVYRATCIMYRLLE